MNSGHWLVVIVVMVAVLVGTAFAAELSGYVEAVDREKGFLSVKDGKEIVEFQCAPGTLKKQVRKNSEVNVQYTEEAGIKKATKVKVHGGC